MTNSLKSYEQSNTYLLMHHSNSRTIFWVEFDVSIELEFRKWFFISSVAHFAFDFAREWFEWKSIEWGIDRSAAWIRLFGKCFQPSFENKILLGLFVKERKKERKTKYREVGVGFLFYFSHRNWKLNRIFFSEWWIQICKVHSHRWKQQHQQQK